jgi:DNA-binding MarR family transcriptional regulator
MSTASKGEGLQDSSSSMKAKWGEEVVRAGWTTVPNTLLKNAYRMNLDPTETLTLIYLLRFWWNAEGMPYPSISKTSVEMGVTRKTMAKKFASLQEKGLIKLVKHQGRRKFSLDGLRERLEYLEKNPKEVSSEEEDDYEALEPSIVVADAIRVKDPQW